MVVIPSITPPAADDVTATSQCFLALFDLAGIEVSGRRES